MSEDDPITLREAAERPQRPSLKGVYIIGYGTKVKIGFTENVANRFQSWVTTIPEELVIYGFLDGLGTEDEQNLHFWFGAHRIRGEWFRKGNYILGSLTPGGSQ